MDIENDEYIAPGTALCPGCGAQLLARHVMKALGKNVVMINVPGCFAISTLFPFTCVRVPFIFAVFGGGPAVAQGVADAIEILKDKYGNDKLQKYKILVYTGDGAAYDIGFQSASAAIHRQLDFYYVCYDNEAYGNTGFQLSSATPYASWTSTSPYKGENIGNIFPKKDLFEIWRAHKPPYLATISISHVKDMMNKFKEAQRYRGPKLFIALSICPTGWGVNPEDTVNLARLAVQTGIWPLKKAIYGEVQHTFIPSKLRNVEEYLRLQRRFRHLFKPKKREEVIREIQENIYQYWENVKAAEKK